MLYIEKFEKLYKNNKFKLSVPTQDDKFYLPSSVLYN